MSSILKDLDEKFKEDVVEGAWIYAKFGYKNNALQELDVHKKEIRKAIDDRLDIEFWKQRIWKELNVPEEFHPAVEGFVTSLAERISKEMREMAYMSMYDALCDIEIKEEEEMKYEE